MGCHLHRRAHPIDSHSASASSSHAPPLPYFVRVLGHKGPRRVIFLILGAITAIEAMGCRERIKNGKDERKRYHRADYHNRHHHRYLSEDDHYYYHSYRSHHHHHHRKDGRGHRHEWEQEVGQEWGNDWGRDWKNWGSHGDGSGFESSRCRSKRSCMLSGKWKRPVSGHEEKEEASCSTEDRMGEMKVASGDGHKPNGHACDSVRPLLLHTKFGRPC